MKVRARNRVIAPVILNLVPRSLSNFTPRPMYSWAKIPVSIERDLGGLNGRSGRCRELNLLNLHAV